MADVHDRHQAWLEDIRQRLNEHSNRHKQRHDNAQKATFKPYALSRSGRRGSFDGKDFYERNREWMEKKDIKMLKEKRKLEKRELAKCSFKPFSSDENQPAEKVFSKSSLSKGHGDFYSRNITWLQEREQKVTRLKREEEIMTEVMATQGFRERKERRAQKALNKDEAAIAKERRRVEKEVAALRDYSFPHGNQNTGSNAGKTATLRARSAGPGQRKQAWTNESTGSRRNDPARLLDFEVRPAAHPPARKVEVDQEFIDDERFARVHGTDGGAAHDLRNALLKCAIGDENATVVRKDNGEVLASDGAPLQHSLSHKFAQGGPVVANLDDIPGATSRSHKVVVSKTDRTAQEEARNEKEYQREVAREQARYEQAQREEQKRVDRDYRAAAHEATIQSPPRLAPPQTPQANPGMTPPMPLSVKYRSTLERAGGSSVADQSLASEGDHDAAQRVFEETRAENYDLETQRRRQLEQGRMFEEGRRQFEESRHHAHLAAEYERSLEEYAQPAAPRPGSLKERYQKTLERSANHAVNEELSRLAPYEPTTPDGRYHKHYPYSKKDMYETSQERDALDKHNTTNWLKQYKEKKHRHEDHISYHDSLAQQETDDQRHAAAAWLEGSTRASIENTLNRAKPSDESGADVSAAHSDGHGAQPYPVQEERQQSQERVVPIINDRESGWRTERTASNEYKIMGLSEKGKPTPSREGDSARDLLSRLDKERKYGKQGQNVTPATLVEGKRVSGGGTVVRANGSFKPSVLWADGQRYSTFQDVDAVSADPDVDGGMPQGAIINSGGTIVHMEEGFKDAIEAPLITKGAVKAGRVISEKRMEGYHPSAQPERPVESTNVTQVRPSANTTTTITFRNADLDRSTRTKMDRKAKEKLDRQKQMGLVREPATPLRPQEFQNAVKQSPLAHIVEGESMSQYAVHRKGPQAAKSPANRSFSDGLNTSEYIRRVKADMAYLSGVSSTVDGAARDRAAIMEVLNSEAH